MGQLSLDYYIRIRDGMLNRDANLVVGPCVTITCSLRIYTLSTTNKSPQIIAFIFEVTCFHLPNLTALNTEAVFP